jgi:hypothetical protein
MVVSKMTRRGTRTHTRTKRNPSFRRRQRTNPASRINPGGISGIAMGGLYIGAGMWLGGIIQGFIPQFGSGMLMDLARGLASAYVVGMVAGRFTGQAGLMAAGAFAPTAVGVIQSLLGGGLSGLTGGLLGGGSKQISHAAPAAQIPAAPAPPLSNVAQFPTSQAG